MAQLTNPTGLGHDGYLRIKKESVYGTPVTTSMVDLPVIPGTLFKGYPELIENSNIIASRLKQDPNQGRLIRTGSIEMDAWPTLLGHFCELHWGTSANAGDASAGYTHTWLAPVSGTNSGVSWTVQQAVGASVADQFDGVVSDSLTFSSDTSGNIKLAGEFVGQGLTEDVTRATSWSFPANSTDPPLYFGNAQIVLTDSNGTDTILLCANSFELSFPMNLDLERFKICASASAEIKEPVFNAIPGCTLSMNIDADRYMMTRARAFTEMSMVITIASVISEAGSTPTYSTITFEIPAVRLAPDTEIPTTEDRTQMDVNFA